MGYSIHVVARSRKLKDEMLEFMQRNLVTWDKLVGTRYRYTSEVLEGGPLLIKDPLALGIRYGVVMGLERDYAYVVVHWMALKIGRKCTVFGRGEYKYFKAPWPVPYYVYDNYERCPVALKKVECGSQWRIVDKYGILKNPYADIRSSLTRMVIGSERLHFTRVQRQGKYVYILKDSDCRKYGIRRGSSDRSPSVKALTERIGKEEIERQRKLIREAMKRLDILWENRLPHQP